MVNRQIIMGVIIGIIAILLWIYVSFTARGRGPILSNTYLWASKEEREKIDFKAEYKLVTRIFGGLALVFSVFTLYIFTEIKWLYVVMWILIILIVIYAVVDTIKSERLKK